VSIGFFVPLVLAAVLWAVFRSTKVGFRHDRWHLGAAFAGIDVRAG
jgi:hypothetical protein